MVRILSTKGFGIDRLKCLVFGNSGSGKTTLLATTGEPTLVLSFESGLLSIANKELVDYVDCTTDDNGNLLPKSGRIERLNEVYTMLATSRDMKEKYKWIAIDSLTELGQNIVEDLQAKFPERKDAMVMWGEYSKQVRSIIKAFRDLPDYNVIFTALTKEERADNGSKYIGVNLQGSIADHLPSFFDEVFYLFVKDDENGVSKRQLLCNAHEMVPAAKDRSGKLSNTEVPNLREIVKKIKTT